MSRSNSPVTRCAHDAVAKSKVQRPPVPRRGPAGRVLRLYADTKPRSSDAAPARRTRVAPVLTRRGPWPSSAPSRTSAWSCSRQNRMSISRYIVSCEAQRPVSAAAEGRRLHAVVRRRIAPYDPCRVMTSMPPVPQRQQRTSSRKSPGGFVIRSCGLPAAALTLGPSAQAL